MFKIDLIKRNHPIILGSLSAIIIGIIIYYLGNLSGYKAKILIEQTVDNFNMLCNTITLACATILALLLNALGSSRSSDANIKEEHYQGLIHLTSLVTFTFITSLFSFLLMLIPITETDKISTAYYNNFYCIMLIVSSVLVGLTITIGLMLRKVIINITRVTALKDHEHNLFKEEKKEKLRKPVEK